MSDNGFALALGVFFGNWLFVPAIDGNRSYWDGFWIGLIAAILVLLMKFVIKQFCQLKKDNQG